MFLAPLGLAMNPVIMGRSVDVPARALASTITIFALLIVPVSMSAQETVWGLGTKKFLTTPRESEPLSISSTGESSLRAYDFVAGVGGVNFEAITEADATVTGHQWHGHYGMC